MSQLTSKRDSAGDYFGNLALKDFQEFSVPNSIEWLPLAPGWKIVALIILGLVLWQLFVQIKKYQANAYRRMALRQLAQLNSDYSNSLLDQRHYLQQLRQLLKATALQGYPRSAVASLNGRQWIAYLDEKTSSSYFHKETELLMDKQLYQQQYQPDSKQLNKFANNVAQWIMHHHA